jgi:CHAT domain-containing protein
VLPTLELIKGSWDGSQWSLAQFDRGNHALLYFVAARETIGAWFYSAGKEKFLVLPATPSEVSRLLVELRERWSSDAAQNSAPALEKLFDELIAPFDAELRGVAQLHIVPDGILFSVPFPALRNARNGTHLIEELELTFSDRLARPRPPAKAVPATANVLLVGEPLANGLPRLPAANIEARRIASIYNNSRVTLLTNENATEAALRSNLPAVSLIHFAGHAIARADAPDQSALMLTAGVEGDDDDGMLTVSELRRQVVLLGRPLVILAACRTADAIGSRRFAAANLAAEWLSAGATGVVATVDDIPDSSGAFFESFHQQLRAGEMPAAALRRAQIDAIHNRTIALPEWARVVLYQ